MVVTVLLEDLLMSDTEPSGAGRWEHRPQTQIKLSRSDPSPCVSVSGVGYDLMPTHPFSQDPEPRSVNLTDN